MRRFVVACEFVSIFIAGLFQVEEKKEKDEAKSEVGVWLHAFPWVHWDRKVQWKYQSLSTWQHLCYAPFVLISFCIQFCVYERRILLLTRSLLIRIRELGRNPQSLWYLLIKNLQHLFLLCDVDASLVLVNRLPWRRASLLWANSQLCADQLLRLLPPRRWPRRLVVRRRASLICTICGRNLGSKLNVGTGWYMVWSWD